VPQYERGPIGAYLLRNNITITITITDGDGDGDGTGGAQQAVTEPGRVGVHP
jgi:hypothetical protein